MNSTAPGFTALPTLPAVSVQHCGVVDCAIMSCAVLYSKTPCPHLRSDAVLFDKGLLGEVDHERIVGGEGHVEAAGEEGGEGVLVVVQEEGVVAQGGHGQANLKGKCNSHATAEQVSSHGLRVGIRLSKHRKGEPVFSPTSAEDIAGRQA